MLVSQPVGECVRIVQGDAVVELSVDEALALFGKLHGILPEMAAPELYRDEETWRCPHCHQALQEDGDLVEYDSHQGESFADLDGDDVFVGQVETTRHTMAFLCGKCRRVVRVPGEMSVDWS